MSLDEKQVYEAIKNRFIAQFMDPAEFEHTEIITCTKGEKYDRLFSTKGKILIKECYLKVENYTGKDELLPKVNKNDIVHTVEIKIECKKTKPPAHHTEKTLLKTMETCGKSVNSNNEDEEDNSSVLSGYSIGTDATRAEIINKLKFAGYIKPKGKSLLITEKGKKLIETFPIKELLDADYTGRMEKALADMEKGEASRDKFLNYIYKITKEGVNKIKNHKANLICDTRQ